jgi:glucokinase
MYLDLLAGFCGSLALATGARGGVFLSGSILNARREALLAERFHQRFRAKGRFAGWLDGLPLRLIRTPEPGLAGLAWRAVQV